MLLSILLINDSNHALEFDSSFNLNVVKNIVKHGIYGTSVYLVDGQKFYWFDPWITTGPTVFLPTALLMKLVDNFILIPRLVMNIFYSLYACPDDTDSEESKKLQFGWIAIYVISLTVIFSQLLSNAVILGVDFVGEVPAYLFALYSIAGLALANPFIAGLSIGLAVLTKLQLIYLCLPLSLGYLYYFYRKNAKLAFQFMVTGALPLIIYGGSLLMIYGRHVKEYYGDFKGVAIMQKAYPGMIGNISSLGSRIAHFLQYDPFFLLLAVIGIIIIIIGWNKYDLRKKIVFASFMLYLGYFLFVWEFIAPRHLVIPKLLLFLFQCSVTLEYLSTLHVKKLIVGTALLSFLLFPSLLESRVALSNQITAANYLKNNYKNSTIYNIGWWKSPELQILLNKDFIRLDKKTENFANKIVSLSSQIQF